MFLIKNNLIFFNNGESLCSFVKKLFAFFAVKKITVQTKKLQPRHLLS